MLHLRHPSSFFTVGSRSARTNLNASALQRGLCFFKFLLFGDPFFSSTVLATEKDRLGPSIGMVWDPFHPIQTVDPARKLRYGRIMMGIRIYSGYQDAAKTDLCVHFIDNRKIVQDLPIFNTGISLMARAVGVLDVPEEKIDIRQRGTKKVRIGIAAGLHRRGKPALLASL